MPIPDPAPKPAADQRARLVRAIRLVAAFAAAVAVIAVVLVSMSQTEWRVHMMVATGLGVFLSVLLGGSLMLLQFFSSSSGHDDEAARFQSKDDER